ncbi:hypothetical protein F2Q68_00031913 [Brassica cretica]|uniref:Uncharacterized protein n=1 Tax=Brassica cretica TaxID=69181 RepID=A0A8S9GDF7_BRACR|nr:hypothetical protein F2Q68_00031913 [Brassica cretica]
MEGKLTVLEATVAELGASNVRLKEKLNRKRKRSRAGSLFPQFVAKHRRRSAPQIPQNIDLPEHDQHASPNSKRRKINQMVAFWVLNLLFSVNTGPNIIILDEVISTISSVPTTTPRTTTLLTTTTLINLFLTTTPLTNTPMTTTLLTTTPLINTLQTRTPPTTALLTTTLQTPTHPTTALLTTTPLTTTLLPTNHLNSPNHKPLNHEPEYPTSPYHNSTEPTISLAHRSPNHHSSYHVSPANNSGVPRSRTFTLSGPVFNTPISPTHRPPPHTALSPQGSPSRHFAPIATLPQFDSTPLKKLTSQSS